MTIYSSDGGSTSLQQEIYGYSQMIPESLGKADGVKGDFGRLRIAEIRSNLGDSAKSLRSP